MKEQVRTDLVNYRIAKARETFKEVQLHINNELWNTAVNRLYYACFYAVIALLVKHGIKAKTHDGTRQLFYQHFIKTGLISTETNRFYSRLFNMRETGDYEDFIEATKEDVMDLIVPAEEMKAREEEEKKKWEEKRARREAKRKIKK